jgi:hypothetical protein
LSRQSSCEDFGNRECSVPSSTRDSRYACQRINCYPRIARRTWYVVGTTKPNQMTADILWFGPCRVPRSIRLKGQLYMSITRTQHLGPYQVGGMLSDPIPDSSQRGPLETPCSIMKWRLNVQATLATNLLLMDGLGETLLKRRSLLVTFKHCSTALIRFACSEGEYSGFGVGGMMHRPRRS